MEPYPIYRNRGALAASAERPLPAEPSPWDRHPEWWRWWSYAALICLLIGSIVAWLFAYPLSGVRTPLSYVAGNAGLLAACFAAIRPGGLVDRRRASRADAARRRDPHAPWLWDHRWDPRGTCGRGVSRLFRATPAAKRILVYGSVVTLLATPPHWAGWTWGMIGGCAVTWTAWRVWHVCRVGTGYVAFTKFPYHPGERVTLHFGMSEGGAAFERVSFRLHRIQEVPTEGLPPEQAMPWAFGELDRRPPGALPGADAYVTLAFDVPVNSRGTSLSSPLRSYWVLDVLANTSSGPYVESFLVPIYERPAAPAAA